MALNFENNHYYTDEGCFITLSDGRTTTTHTHDFLEIVYVFSGSSLQIVDGTEYTASAGDLLFINLGSSHSFTCSKRFSYANIILKPEFINSALLGTDNAFSLLELEDFRELKEKVDRTSLLAHLNPEECGRFEALIDLAISEQKADEAGKEVMLRSAFNALLTFTFRKMSLPIRKNDGIGDRLLDSIRLNCTQHISIEKLAADNHYNPTYFSRLFKAKTGQTFTEYVISCRLELAARLLKETELSVSDICLEVGFSNRTKFFKEFSKKYELSPLKYRKNTGR